MTIPAERAASAWVAVLVAFGVALLTAARSEAEAASRPAPPHIVFILIDDLGWGDVGYHDGPFATPNIDRLAREGVRLEAHYVHPECSPTRAALMTGKFSHRVGVTHALEEWEHRGLPLGETTVAEALSPDYETAIVGKWHLGDFPPYRPTQRGFDHQYGSYFSPRSYFTRRDHSGGIDWHRDDGPALREDGYTTTLQGDEAVRRIQERDVSRPLFLYVAFNAVHAPLHLPPGAAIGDRSLPRKRQVLGAMLDRVDREVGRIRAALEATGMAGDTVLVVASDNGANLDEGGSAFPLRGGKHTTWEGGIRVPAIAWCPRRWAPRATAETVHVVDWFPTLLGIAGRPAPEGLDGRDLLGVLVGGPSPHEDGLVLTNHLEWSAYRLGSWKLIRHGFRLRLYNLETDPGERKDLAAKAPDVLAVMKRRFLGGSRPPSVRCSGDIHSRFPFPLRAVGVRAAGGTGS